MVPGLGGAYRVRMKAKSNDVVSASEIASWAWCSEAWRLQKLGEEPTNQEERARGDTFHARTSTTEVASRRVAVIGRWLLVLGLLAATICIAFIAVGDR